MREKRRSSPGGMALGVALTQVAIIALTSLAPALAGERWSRQLTEFTGGSATGTDWIPLSRPIAERQAGARVLNYFSAPPQPQFLGPDNTAAAQQHHFTFLNHQFPQSNRFLLQQPAPQQQPQQQELLEQPPFHLSSFQRSPPQFVGQTIQHPPPPPPQPQPISSSNPFEQQFLGGVKSPLSEALIQEDKPQPQQLEQQSFSYQHIRQPELDGQPGGGPPPPQQPGAVSQEEVQLLYVPVETLYNQKQQSQLAPDTNRYNALPQPVSPSLINDFYTAGTTTTTPKPPARTSAATFATQPPQRVYTSAATETSAPALTSRSSSTSASKPKPNQPPLALFLYNDGRQGKLSTSDAIGGLKNIHEIAVLDAFGKNTPKVFIGPNGLAPPKSYSRFDLPYLSSVDLSSNRANRKIEDLPFFVAPLSYKTPGGYTKIALPPPHVGSIVVRQSGSTGSGGNSLEHGPFYTRPTAPSNVQYYTPSTLNFGEDAGPTKAPITLGATGKPIYDADHYTSPTGKPASTVGQYSSFQNSPLPPSRHPGVNEEYFNLAKTKKPSTSPAPAPTTANYPFRSYGGSSTRQFDFKPMPEQKIPPSFYPVEEQDDTTTTIFTTPTTTTTTERPTTAQLHFEAERMRTHFREENFRSRTRPHHHQQTTPATAPLNEGKEQQFVHKFKLVDSVRPNAGKVGASSSVVDHGFLDFFNPPSQQHTDEMIKTTITTSLPGSGGIDRQVIRNNYYTAAAAIGEDSGANRHSKYVSTYYNPSSTSAGTTAGTTTPATLTTQDVFFRDFEHRSKFYEREPTKYETNFPTTSTTFGTTVGTSYINKYKYETDSYSDSPRYSVEVITTSEPTTAVTVEPTHGTTEQQHYSIPSELPPISANLPGLVNALMDEQWSPKTPDTGAQTPSGNARGPHFRKQLHRTTTTQSSDAYDADQAVPTTRRPLQRGRRPHPSRTTTPATPTGEAGENSGHASTRAPISRSRSRYVPNNEERPASSRGRSRGRTTTPRGPRKEEENLDYQRDVLKQNYPVIRPQAQGVPAPTTTPPPTTIATTPSTTLQETYDDPSERFISTTLANELPLDTVDPQQQVTRKYSTYYSEPTYDQETPSVTTVVPPQTPSYYVPSSYNTRTQAEDEEEYVRPQEVIPLNREPELHSVIPLRSQTLATEAPPQTAPPPVTESEEKLTTAYGAPLEEAMEIKKVEITPRPRRPGLVSRTRDSQQTYATRTTTERTTITSRTTTPEPAAAQPPSGAGASRTSAGRRPAFVRRPSRLYATTTASPTTTAAYTNEQQQQPTQGTYTVRTKNRQDILRGRTRRPTTTTEPAAAAAVTTASPEAPVTRAFGRGSNLRRISPTLRSRQEQTAAATTQQPSTAAAPGVSSGPRFRIRERTRFNLQPQESQWSTKLNQNSFQPVLKTESRANDLEQENVSTEPEPEIVTAARDTGMYFVNVSSNYGQKGGANSPQDAPTEDSTENSVPSFADLLNDVMKDFIDDNSQKKPESEEKDRVSSEEATRRPITSNFRNNFLRKRGRSKVVDSFETAESQHINQAAQVYNGQAHFGETLKTIDHVGLTGKNIAEKHRDTAPFEEQENTAQEQATVAPEEEPKETETGEASVEVITAVSDVSAPTSTSKPTAEELALEQTSTNVPLQQDHTTEASVTLEPIAEDDGPTFAAPEEEEENQQPPSSKQVSEGIFADVKKTISDLYEMAEHDAETEEMVDGGGEQEGEREDEFLHATEDTLAADDAVESDDEQEVVPATTDISPSETQFVPVTAEPPAIVNPMGSLVIPTSVSNGITHETEICYRGRCIKTEDDKRKRKFKLN